MKEIIFDKIHSHVLPWTPSKSITLKTEFSRHTNIDSLKIMDMVMDLEDSFDITLPINALSEVKTVEDLVEQVYNRIQDTDAIMV